MGINLENKNFVVIGRRQILADFEHPRNETEALELSIEKWEFIVKCCEDGLEVDCGHSRTCALCQFHDKRNSLECQQCVVGKAGYLGCNKTPYENYNRNSSVEGKLAAAKDEVEFLKSLRGQTDGEEIRS